MISRKHYHINIRFIKISHVDQKIWHKVDSFIFGVGILKESNMAAYARCNFPRDTINMHHQELARFRFGDYFIVNSNFNNCRSRFSCEKHVHDFFISTDLLTVNNCEI